ncbi:MAG: hypothetical protein SVK54_01425, partial [candidate division WOR-3 bacterium]|nr:hypothetical protein [candidate division WOR-3 bacterium]
MGKEKERRFIVLDIPDLSGVDYSLIEQIYIECSLKDNTLNIRGESVRVPPHFRLLNDTARLRMIDKSHIEINSKRGQGIEREEYEFTCTVPELAAIIEDDDSRLIKKRYALSDSTVLDNFTNRYSGLSVLETEITEEYIPPVPDWAGPEITYDKTLSNYSMYMSDSDEIWEHIRRLTDDNPDTQT